MSKPQLTQHMTLHLNGGSKFSELHYAIHADGEPTGITLHKRTDGRPEYRYTDVVLRDGEVEVDLLAEDAPDAVEWIYGRLAPRQEADDG